MKVAIFGWYRVTHWTNIKGKTNIKVRLELRLQPLSYNFQKRSKIKIMMKTYSWTCSWTSNFYLNQVQVLVNWNVFTSVINSIIDAKCTLFYIKRNSNSWINRNGNRWKLIYEISIFWHLVQKCFFFQTRVQHGNEFQRVLMEISKMKLVKDSSNVYK